MLSDGVWLAKLLMLVVRRLTRELLFFKESFVESMEELPEC